MNIFHKARKKGLIYILLLTIPLFTISAQEKAISMKLKKDSKNIEVIVQVNKGYGIQKNGPHQMTVYKGENPDKSVNKQNILHDEKKVRFSGKTSREDKEYFSSVDPFIIPVKTSGPVTVKVKIFYCSFTDSFCSVEIIQSVVK